MTLEFRVAYGTVMGESLWLEMELGGITQELPMEWADAGHWELEVEAEDGVDLRNTTTS